MSAVERIVVEAKDADQRLDRWLRKRFPGLTQGRIEKLLRTGQIRLDGKRADAKIRVYAGHEVRLPPNFDAPPPPPARAAVPEKDAEFVRGLVIHEDPDVLVLDKPAGLAVQGGSGTPRHIDGMLDALALDGERPRLVHRLDRDTSGVLVLGRNPRAAAKLAEAFRGKATRKLYWALVAGAPTPPEGRIDLALAKVAGSAGERVAADAEEGLRAITDYATVDAALDRVAWLAMAPITGRTHQLRVHAATALGTPIVGDAKYGGARAAPPAGTPLRPLLHLHARAIDLPHPEGGRLRVQANLPPHMAEAWAFFGFEEADGDALNLFDRTRS